MNRLVERHDTAQPVRDILRDRGGGAPNVIDVPPLFYAAVHDAFERDVLS